VIEAFAWGFGAGLSLLLGGLLALAVRVPRRALGLIMAFGAGVLISAVAYELVEDAVQADGRGVSVALGLFAGALAFYLGDLAIDHLGGADRKSMEGEQTAGRALAIVLGIVLDGVPESAVIGLTLLGGRGVSAATVAAVFISNLPEAIAATTGLAQSSWPRPRILGLWLGVAAASGLAALGGHAFFDDAGPAALAFVLAFAGGAILTMLADTMVPQAFAFGGRAVGLLTTLGFAVAFGISAVG
jgi:ZIP family zinc transporter